MQRQWEPEELIEQWTLLPADLALLANKSGSTRLGFAVLLLYFQHEGRFPLHRHDVPRPVVAHIAAQAGVPATEYPRYPWDGRSIKYHRSQIRDALGFREATVPDAAELTEWLCTHAVARDAQDTAVTAAAYQRLRALKVEPPSAERIARIVHSAIHTYVERLGATVLQRLTPATLMDIAALLATEEEGVPNEREAAASPAPLVVSFPDLKADPGRLGLDSVLQEVAKLERLRRLDLPTDLFAGVAPKLLQQYRQRAASEPLRELRRHPHPLQVLLVAAFCFLRSQDITDSLVDLLIQLVHKISVRAEHKVERELLDDLKRVTGKTSLLYQLAEAALEHPDERVRDVVYPVVSEETLRDLVREYKATGRAYRRHVQTVMRASYRNHYRRMVPLLLRMLTFRSNNAVHRPVVSALRLLQDYADSKQHFYSPEEMVPLDGVVPSAWRDLVVERDKDGRARVNRVTYEIYVLQALRDKLRCKEIWVVGANRYRNPDDDLPADFEDQRETYYAALRQPREAAAFSAELQETLTTALATLERGLPKNPAVEVLSKGGGWIKLSPLEPQPEPPNLARLKAELGLRWPMTSLLDILKETDLRVGFTEQFKSVAARETLDRATLQRRLLLCLYGLGTNTGLKRVSAGEHGESYHDVLYVRRRFLHKAHLRNAIAQVVNAIFRTRRAPIWGEGTTACASDSKKFGAWDQNLMTEWHIRYGGRGVMIYWHVERNAACIYSQLKTCSSSEVAAMIEGVLRHCTDMTVEKNFVDSHGQSEIAFAFCHLLGFQLLPRLKGIHAQKLYRPAPGAADDYPHLQSVLTRAINWEIIRQQYDQMIKYATALRLGTAETEAILRRFTRSGVQHPTYQALAELGKAIKTIFLCQYLHAEALRREIHEGLNVVENWNSANSFIFYGKGGEIATNRLDDQELAVLALHLLQLCLVYINTLMIQQVLAEETWRERLTPEDLRALTPLLYSHVNPYGTFRLDMQERLALAQVSVEEAVG